MPAKIIITGTNGTIGQVLVPFLQARGIEIIPWDRSIIPIDDYSKMETFIIQNKPTTLIHLAAITSFDTEERKNSWQVNYEWPSELAWICMIHQIKFIFTSTALVFSGDKPGPYTINSIPDAQLGYGHEKRKAEERVIAQNSESVILRFGWQIAGDQAEGRQGADNSMLNNLDNQMQEKGEIRASDKWLPSCSFIQDTVEIIAQSLSFPKGIYQINSNTNWSFYQIVSALKIYYNKDWNIIQTEDHDHDQRMLDDRIQIKTLEEKIWR